jgi:drug/metabolite transporter (DMT)-like permease
MVYLRLVLTAVFWGGTFIAGRVLASEVGPYSAAFLRFLLASAFLLVFVMRYEKRWPRLSLHQVGPVVILGLTGVFAYNVLFFKGLKLISAGRASLIVANNPVFIVLLSALFFKERLSRSQFAGVGLSMAGAMIVISRGNLSGIFAEGVGWGELFIAGCVASWAAYSLIGKVVLQRLSPVTSVCYSAMIGTAALLLPALHFGLIEDMRALSVDGWVSICYLGFFGTVLGFVWYYEGVRELGPSRASIFINFVPVFAILLAFLILGEPVTRSLILGACFVLVGVYLTNRSRRPSPRGAGGDVVVKAP